MSRRTPVRHRRGPYLALVLALGALPALAVSAETFLVAVTETDDGEPSRPPLAAREGIFTALFDGEHIGFEVPIGMPLPSTEELRLLAADAGAGTVALVVVDWHEERIAGGALRVRGRGSLRFVDAGTGVEAAAVPLAVDNGGREATVDRRRLGVEIGIALIAAYRPPSLEP